MTYTVPSGTLNSSYHTILSTLKCIIYILQNVAKLHIFLSVLTRQFRYIIERIIYKGNIAI